MEDYGMCCGPNEARQCAREYYERMIEEDLHKSKLVNRILLGLVISLAVIIIPILLYLSGY